jgi:ABC-type multidrug transport system permease subunit
MDSVYQMVAAIAKDSSQAQLLLLPFLLVFLLYNGFTASRNSVPSCMVWALRISPVAQAMEEVVTWSNFALDGELQVVVDLLGYTEHSKEALGYLVAFVVFFRSLQVICLKMLNSVKR